MLMDGGSLLQLVVLPLGVEVMKLCLGLMVATTSKVRMGDTCRSCWVCCWGAVVVTTARDCGGGGAAAGIVGVEAPDLAAFNEDLSSFSISPSRSRLSRRRWLSRRSRSLFCCFWSQDRLASSSDTPMPMSEKERNHKMHQLGGHCAFVKVLKIVSFLPSGYDNNQILNIQWIWTKVTTFNTDS